MTYLIFKQALHCENLIGGDETLDSSYMLTWAHSYLMSQMFVISPDLFKPKLTPSMAGLENSFLFMQM